MAKKLIIEVDNREREPGIVVRVSDKANALLEDVAKKSKRSKDYVASRMIEFAYEFVQSKRSARALRSALQTSPAEN